MSLPNVKVRQAHFVGSFCWLILLRITPVIPAEETVWFFVANAQSVVRFAPYALINKHIDFLYSEDAEIMH